MNVMNKDYLKKQLIYKDAEESVYFGRQCLFFEKKEARKKVRLRCKNPLVFFHLFRRLFRFDIRCFSKINDRYFFFLKGSLYMVDDCYVIKKIRNFSNMSSPLYLSANISKTKIIFGDYSNSAERKEVNIYSLDYYGNLEIIYSFPPNSVKHIHNIIPIPNIDDSYYVLTGDSDDESGIWILNKKAISPLLVGKQKYRSCFLFPKKNGFIYFTDSPISKNYIYEYQLDCNQMKQLHSINGPCINAVAEHGIVFFSTSVEPNPLKTGLFNNFKVSESILENYIYIYKLDTISNTLSVLLKIKKDLFDMRLFGLGNAKLLYLEKKLYINIYGTYKYYGKTIVIKGELD